MEFFAVNGTRPLRLSEATRKFAYESLNHKYGRQTWETDGIRMDDYEGFERLDTLAQYDAMITQIAKYAPLRICEGEKISGAATLGPAINHKVPGMWQGSPVFESVSHLTIDFETVLKKGVDYLQEQAEEALERYKGTGKEPFSRSCLNCLQAMRVWHGRYLEQLSQMSGYEKNYENLCQVPFSPAKNFYQAVQCMWFQFAFTRLCGNWPGIGRIDWLLKEYLEKDLAEGNVTLEQAREILAHFFIKGCEWIRGEPVQSGDAQHYQNILLGGIDEDGVDVTNPVTYLVLDIIEELGISDFPVTVRINRNTDRKLLERVAEVIRYGGGVVAIYNEDLILESLVNYGYSLQEARNFANDGCWEVQIPGKTYFGYHPFDGLRLLQSKTLDDYSGQVAFEDFEALYSQYVRDLREQVENMIAQVNQDRFSDTHLPVSQWKWKERIPCTVVSLFEGECIQKGQSYFEGGANYNVLSPHFGGLPDVVNSLYAIQKLVFIEKRVSWQQLMEFLRNNWEGNEALRQFVMNRYSYFGNDNDEVDVIAKRLVADFGRICNEVSEGSALNTPAGISTFGRQLEWSEHRFATAYGKKASEVLAGNFSPTPGTDKDGATAVIKSYCKADLRDMVTGAALDLKLLPSAVNRTMGREAIISLIESFVGLGGYFLQMDVVDMQMLKQAQLHPENYQNLSVRVSGWNARFVTMNKQWQDMIIAQRGGDF